MIIKLVGKSSEAGEYFSTLYLEADRVEVQFHKCLDDAGGNVDWSYTDQQSHPQGPLPGYYIRTWSRWPSQNYEAGVVRSGRIFIMNGEGKTVDKYVI